MDKAERQLMMDDPDNIAFTGAPLNRAQYLWFGNWIARIEDSADQEGDYGLFAHELADLFGWKSIIEWAPRLYQQHLIWRGAEQSAATEAAKRFSTMIQRSRPESHYSPRAIDNPTHYFRGLIARPGLLERLLIETMQDYATPRDTNPVAKVMATARLDGIISTIAALQGALHASHWVTEAVRAAARQAGLDSSREDVVSGMVDDILDTLFLDSEQE